jgi:hypothetical protein
MMTGWLETSLRGSYTPLYASPQQSRGASPDPRDDVHALGVIAFQMLTGKLAEAPSPRFERDLRRRGVPDEFIELIGDCVDSDPSARPKDAVDLADRLNKLKTAKTATTTTTPSAPTKPAETKTNPAQAKPTEAKPEPKPAEAKPASPKPAATPVTRTPLEGGSPPTAFLPFATPLEPEKWLIPFRGTWFSRSTEKPDSPWAPGSVRLPGDVITRPGEAYRLAFSPDTTGDDDLAKLKSLAGLPGLEAIDLSGCARVTDAGLMHLAHLRGLRAVGLADTQVTDSGVTLLLTRFPDLEAIGLAGTANVSQTVVPYLARMRKLKMLALPPRADTIDVRLEFAKRRPTCQLV